MSSHILDDEKIEFFSMSYSGGEQHELNAIGFVTSADGLKWPKHENNPVFRPDLKIFARKNTSACWFVMYSIGLLKVDHAQIGNARSKNRAPTRNTFPSTPSFSPAKANGTTMPFASLARPLTGRNGSCGTTTGVAAISKSASRPTKAKTWTFSWTIDQSHHWICATDCVRRFF